MKGVYIFVEGGGNGRDTQIRCEEGFRKLLEQCGYRGRMPRIFACGSRKDAYDDFKATQANSGGKYVALLVDSEDPVADIEKPWEHLRKRDGKEWERPANAAEEQALLMATCMETWLVADRATLKQHYHGKFQESALPSLVGLEGKDRHQVQDALTQATRECSNKYEKGKRSFEPLGKLNPAVLEAHLPCFKRMKRILDEKL